MLTINQHLIDGKLNSAVFEVDENDLDAWYPPIVGFRYNHVVSAKHGSENSEKITNAHDRAVLRFIRTQSDLIVTSGKTAVDENIGSSAFAPLLIITRRKDINFRALEIDSRFPVFLTLKEGNWHNKNAIAIGEMDSDLDNFMQSFKQRYPRIVLETGMSITGEVAHKIEDLCLTVVDATNSQHACVVAAEFADSLRVKLPMSQQLEINGTYFFRFYRPQES